MFYCQLWKNDCHSQTKNSFIYFNPLLKGCFHPSKYSLDGIFFSTSSFLNISRGPFRSLREKVWEIKTLTVSTTNHTQNISTLREGNIRAPQTSGGWSPAYEMFLCNHSRACSSRVTAHRSPWKACSDLPGPSHRASHSAGLRGRTYWCCWPGDPGICPQHLPLSSPCFPTSGPCQDCGPSWTSLGSASFVNNSA